MSQPELQVKSPPAPLPGIARANALKIKIESDKAKETPKSKEKSEKKPKKSTTTTQTIPANDPPKKVETQYSASNSGSAAGAAAAAKAGKGKGNNVNTSKTIGESSQTKVTDSKGKNVPIYKLSDFMDKDDPKDKKSDESSAPEQKKDIGTTVASINLEAIKKLTPYFIKSYYAHDFLTPYIRCFIQSKEYRDEPNEVRKKNFTKNFFDIPYNLIKSMDVEFIGGATGVAGSLKLKIEDASGSIGSFLVAGFYSLSATGDIGKVPHVSIEFGWAEKGLKKISRKKQNQIRTKNFYPRYLIINIEIEFSDKGKQEIIITAKQDDTGTASFTSSNKSGLSPFAVIGPQPTVNIRLLQYYFYFKKEYSQIPLFLSLPKFNLYKNASKEDQDKIWDIVLEFLKNYRNGEMENYSEKFKTEGIIKNLYQKNLFFNIFENLNSPASILMKEQFNIPLNKSYFNSYLVFCYILNQYIQTLKHVFLKNQEQVEVILLPLYEEKQIDNTGLIIDNYDSIANFCVRDVQLGYDKEKGTSCLVTATDQIGKNDSWEDVLNKFAKLVKFTDNNDVKKRSNLFITIKRYDNKNANIDDLNRNDKEFYKTGPKEELIKKFESLKKIYKEKENEKAVKQIDDFIQEIKAQKKDFVYIVLTKGSPFITDENYGDKIIAQSYTIYPKIKFQERIKDQNFNSGSEKNSLLEESFPDVIYFKPQIPFSNLVNSSLSQKSNFNYNNGAFSFENKKFIIKSMNSQEKDFTIQEIISFKEKLTNFLKLYQKKEKTTRFIEFFEAPLGSDGQVFYRMREIDANIKIYHKSLTARKIQGSSVIRNYEKDDIELVNDIISDIDEYIDTISRGYHFNALSDIIKKTNNNFIGDNNTVEYYSYVDATDEYNKMLASGATGFKAELKILGEPAFTFDFSGVVHVFIKVYNLNGSLNYLLTGLYGITKVKHEISEGGSFTTTLELMFQSAYVG